MGIRSIGYFAVLIILFLRGSDAYTTFWYALAFSHHFLGFYFAVPHVKSAKGSVWKISLIWGSILLGTFLGLLYEHWIIALSFGIHHILTETYAKSDFRRHQTGLLTLTSWVSVSRLAVESSILLLICFNDPFVNSWLAQDTLTVVSLTSVLLHIVVVFKLRLFLGESWASQLWLPFVGFVAYFVFSFFDLLNEIRIIEHVIFYHVTTWIFFPLTMTQGSSRLSRPLPYLGVMVAMVLAIYVLSYPVVLPGADSQKISVIERAIFVVSQIHILSSLFLSKWNPRIFFQPYRGWNNRAA